MALFDGISKQTNVNIGVREPKLFYYKVSEVKPIKIFMSTPSNTIDFYFSATLVENNKFAQRNDTDEVYPIFVPRDVRTSNPPDLPNYYSAELDSIGSSALAISKN